jgi:hypothetical protein
VAATRPETNPGIHVASPTRMGARNHPPPLATKGTNRCTIHQVNGISRCRMSGWQPSQPSPVIPKLFTNRSRRVIRCARRKQAGSACIPGHLSISSPHNSRTITRIRFISYTALCSRKAVTHCRRTGLANLRRIDCSLTLPACPGTRYVLEITNTALRSPDKDESHLTLC